MRTFTEPLKELKEFETLSEKIHDLHGIVQISGCIDAAKPHIMYSVNNGSGNRIIVTFQEQRAKELYEEYRFFDPKAAYYPAKDILFYQSDIRGNVLTAERINALKMLAEESSCTIITTFDGLMNPMPMPEKFIQAVKKISVGDTQNIEELTKHLVELGYEKNYQAETMGEFSVRGGILDIFPLTEDNPYRIEFWGDEVDSIRSFDAESQRSIENLEEISIYPASELVLTQTERQEGIKRILKEAEKVSAKLRKEMKTEEAHRTKSAAAQIAEEAGELGISAGLDAYLSYFCEDRVSLLEYFNRDNTVIFVDELARSIERGMVTETEFSESMKQRLENRIAELEQSLSQAESKHQRALSMAQQTKQGHVYIISNIGSFGENVYKIGMTRRLDPQDRVNELGDASVPFIFDVHAMIYSEDAPSLEKNYMMSSIKRESIL